MGEIISNQFNAQQKRQLKNTSKNQKNDPGLTPVFKIATLDPYEHEYYNHRIVRIAGPITTAKAVDVIAKMRLLADLDPKKEIELLIHSAGGSITAGLAIFDFMKSLPCPIRTTAEGESCSMGAVLLAAGTPGLRTAMPNARIMVHQAARIGGGHETTSEMSISLKEIERLQDKLVEIMAGFAQISFEDMNAKIQRDNYMSADQAKASGLIDHVWQPMQLIPKPLPPTTPSILRLAA